MHTNKTLSTRKTTGNLSAFFERYTAILYGARDFVTRVATVAMRSGEDPFVTMRQIAEHIAEHQPAMYLKTFGIDESKQLKVWRIKSLLANASFLGALEAIGLTTVRGRGVVSSSYRRLRVINGGRS